MLNEKQYLQWLTILATYADEWERLSWPNLCPLSFSDKL